MSEIDGAGDHGEHRSAGRGRCVPCWVVVVGTGESGLVGDASGDREQVPGDGYCGRRERAGVAAGPIQNQRDVLVGVVVGADRCLDINDLSVGAQVSTHRRHRIEHIVGISRAVVFHVGPEDPPRRRDELERTDRPVPHRIAVPLPVVGIGDAGRAVRPVERNPDDRWPHGPVKLDGRAAVAGVVRFGLADPRHDLPREPRALSGFGDEQLQQQRGDIGDRFVGRVRHRDRRRRGPGRTRGDRHERHEAERAGKHHHEHGGHCDGQRLHVAPREFWSMPRPGTPHPRQRDNEPGTVAATSTDHSSREFGELFSAPRRRRRGGPRSWCCIFVAWIPRDRVFHRRENARNH